MQVLRRSAQEGRESSASNPRDCHAQDLNDSKLQEQGAAELSNTSTNDKMNEAHLKPSNWKLSHLGEELPEATPDKHVEQPNQGETANELGNRQKPKIKVANSPLFSSPTKIKQTDKNEKLNKSGRIELNEVASTEKKQMTAERDGSQNLRAKLKLKRPSEPQPGPSPE